MSIHRSSVNFENLIRDLAEMYPVEVGEVVLTELVANALDSGAMGISVEFDPASMTLRVQDDGSGMTASQFNQYHDFAAGLKTRGMGIGFAGVGAKISFNIADRVITETKSRSFSGGSDWYLRSKHELVWEEIVPKRVAGYGTLVEVHFRVGTRVPFATPEEITSILRRNYLPLFDADFMKLYSDANYYPADLHFRVNGDRIPSGSIARELQLRNLKEFFPKHAGRRVGYGLFGLAPSDYPLGPNICGVLLCTRGKVVKADLFNQFPARHGARICGLVEVPDFIRFLTTSKTDFVAGRKHREFERLYDPIRQEFKRWLSDIGIGSIEVEEIDEAARLERELRKLVNDLPELADFFGFRSPAQAISPSAAGNTSATLLDGSQMTLPEGSGDGATGPGPSVAGEETGPVLVASATPAEVKAEPISRKARRGPRISFVRAPDRQDIGWVEGNNVIINSGHPCYVRVANNPASRRLHQLYAVATAVQRFLATDNGRNDLMFVDRMMSAWAQK